MALWQQPTPVQSPGLMYRDGWHTDMQAAADVVAFAVDEVAKDGAAERDEGVLCVGEAVVAVHQLHVDVVAAPGRVDLASSGVVAGARRAHVGPSLAGFQVKTPTLTVSSGGDRVSLHSRLKPGVPSLR
jgi:hypothetical protein